MYTGQDLVDVQTALDALTSDDFFQYDFNLGTKYPYLSITISNAQQALYPSLKFLPQVQPLISVFYTADFSAPVADFIAAFQLAAQQYAVTQLPIWKAYFNQAQTFQNFLDILATKQ